MRRVYKFFLSVISIMGLLFSICIVSFFYNVPFITEKTRAWLASYNWLNSVFAGYSALIGLCFFILLMIALLSPSRLNFLVIEKSKGKIQISKRNIESVARYSFLYIEAVGNSIIKVKLNKKPEKTKIFIKLFLNDTSEIVSLTEKIQNDIEVSLQSSLGISVKSISIKVSALNPKTADEKIGRVI